MRQVAQRALALYGVEPLTLSLLHHAYNTTFKVVGPDGARYVLHILRPPEDVASEGQWRARLESELWWLDRVRVDLGLSLPAAVRTPEGEGVAGVAVEGRGLPQLCTLFQWVDGRFPRRRLYRRQLQAVGRLTARLHKHSEQLHAPTWFDRPRVDGADEEIEESVARLFADHVSVEAADVMRRAVRQVRLAQHELGSGSDTFGPIHADIHQKNYLFHGGDVRLIDFGDCGWGHYLYDPAVTLSELVTLPNRAELRAALLAGYREVRDLSPRHEALIQSFVALREVQNLTWFVKARNDPSYRKRAEQIGDRVAELERLLRAAEF
jgi:Ser/Thr protein kinase RdoA (MazF antagonist)